MKAKNSTIYVSKTVGPSKGSPPPKGEEDIVAIHKFETEPALVTAEYALTMNLGNYESARISVSVTVPCYKEEIDEAYEFAQAWAEERLSKERNMIDSGRKGGNSPL
jgi:hypothetical protein